ncbi:MAG TPA: hypothetical protein VJ508_14180 [Saprospiraceae bacterium]|nr:hypothetical protein [Saprospiraceae bacterium]
MRKLFLMLLGASLFVIFLSGCDKDSTAVTERPGYIAFSKSMRELWSDHALWTRNVIINILDGTPGTNEAVTRLLQNQKDIGNAIRPYYGDAGADGLTDLLTTHITIAADLLTAAKSGDAESYNTAHTAWYANGDEIATFLNTANPDHFPLDAWKSMMKTHLDLTLNEATARLTQDYAGDVAAYDQVYAELMMMADMLSEGIAKQFPDKF